MKNLPFLFAAYSAVWVFLFLYITNLVRRNRALQRDIDELRELLRGGGHPSRAASHDRSSGSGA
jgi:CcmD family protein